jgi:hypothetical protein
MIRGGGDKIGRHTREGTRGGTTFERLVRLLNDYNIQDSEVQAEYIIYGTDFYFTDAWAEPSKTLNTRLSKSKIKEWEEFYDLLFDLPKITDIRISSPKRQYVFKSDVLQEFAIMFKRYKENEGKTKSIWKSHYTDTRISSGIRKLREVMSDQKLLGERVSNRKVNVFTYKILEILEIVENKSNQLPVYAKHLKGSLDKSLVEKIKKLEDGMNSFILKHL